MANPQLRRRLQAAETETEKPFRGVRLQEVTSRLVRGSSHPDIQAGDIR